MPFNFNKEQFLDWLRNLPPLRQLMVFDTSFSGTAINKMKKLLSDFVQTSETVSFGSVELVGVRESATPIPPEVLMVHAKSGDRVQITVTNITVPDLITEDKNELIGYDAIKRDETFAAIGVNAVVRLVSETGKCLGVSGGGDAAGSVLRWLRDVPTGPVLTEKQEKVQTEAAVRMILDNQRDRERLSVLEMQSRGVLDDATRDSELDLIDRRYQGALIRECDFFAGADSTWRDSPQLILHQLKEKTKKVARHARERR